VLAGGPLARAAEAGAQTVPEPTAAPADSAPGLRVELITLGPGPLVWERFGHNALRVVDPASGLDVAYNWGMFSFDEPGFLGRLLKGTMMYWMAPFDSEGMLAAYRGADRSIWIQELALTDAQKVELRDILATNALPQNAYYRYDYYRDNCSTRVRDALDRVTGGRVRAVLQGAPTGTSYRWHTRRLLQDMPSMYTGIQLVLSGRADREIDRWEEAFLPVKLMEAVREVRVLDDAGVERPLVASEREDYRSLAVSEPAAPPRAWPWFLGLGLALAAVLAALASVGAGWSRALTALLGGAWGAAAGIAGVVLIGAWLFTDHVFWYPNWNLLQTNPLGLALAALLLPLLARGRPSSAATVLAMAIGALSLLGLLVHLVTAQRNGDILALTVPLNLGVAGALLRARRSGEPLAGS